MGVDAQHRQVVMIAVDRDHPGSRSIVELAAAPEDCDALVVGAGPAGLMSADVLASAGYAVTIVERMPSPARKLLMAGRGGLNLTHSESFDRFLDRYRCLAPQLQSALRAYPPDALRAWADSLGAETFVGSSGRVFPRAMKASPLVRAWLLRLTGLGVRMEMRTLWTGWDASNRIRTRAPDGSETVREARVLVLAAGGASWPRLGSDGAWSGILTQAGDPVTQLRPANAGLLFDWTEHIRSRFAGAPLKRIAASIDGGRAVRGEAVFTASGLEGGAIYAIFPDVRDAFARGDTPAIVIDLRPDLSLSELAERLARPRNKQSAGAFLRRYAQLSPVAVALLHETTGGSLPKEPAELARRIKSVKLHPTGTAGLARAISTAGGIPFSALDAGLMLKTRPGVFACGEMLDWEAPTGGYLLQATFATAVQAANAAVHWLRDCPTRRPAGTKPE